MWRAAILLAVLLAQPALAAPRAYVLDTAKSSVGFIWAFGPDPVNGDMLVHAAEVLLDLDRPANSSVQVVVDATSANAGFAFATEAIKSPKVLDTNRFPRITFVSTMITRTETGADIQGNITIRGVTKPVIFRARYYRQIGTAVNDRSHLEVHLTSTIRRSDFGASGWSDVVGDAVTLEIVAVVNAAS